MCKYSHRDKHDHKIEEHGSICQYAELLQSPHLTDCKPSERPKQAAHSVAESELGHLGEGLSVADDNDTHGYQKLESLQKVDNVPQWTTPCAECEITIILGRKLVRVDAKENAPQEPARTDL
jgi:hypothetical protein